MLSLFEKIKRIREIKGGKLPPGYYRMELNKPDLSTVIKIADQLIANLPPEYQKYVEKARDNIIKEYDLEKNK